MNVTVRFTLPAFTACFRSTPSAQLFLKEPHPTAL
jgi:hypothetical protein